MSSFFGLCSRRCVWGHPRRVLEVGAVERVQLADVGEVEQTLHRVDGRRRDPEPRLEPRQHRARDRARHLEPDNGAEAPLAQFALHGLEQVVGVVRDLGVTVAGQPERDALEHLHLGEERAQEVADDRFERQPQAARPDLHEPGQALRDLHAREALLAGRVVADDDAKAQRQAGDVRERLSGPDRERRQHRVDLVVEHALEVGKLLLRGVVDGADPDALGGERGAQVVAPQVATGRRRGRARVCGSRRASAAASCRRASRPVSPARTWS